MTDQTITDVGDVHRFTADLLRFVRGDDRTTFDRRFDDAVVEIRGTVWRVDGIVRGAHRVVPIGGTDPPGMALGVDLALRIDDGRGEPARATVRSGAGHVRLDVDRPEALTGALPLGKDASAVVRALADAGTRVEIYGPPTRLAVLDPGRSHRIAGLLTGEPGVRLAPGAVPSWLRYAGGRVGAAVTRRRGR